MSVLLISELYSCGGAEEIARLELMLLEERGLKTSFLTFDYSQAQVNGYCWTNCLVNPSSVVKLLSRISAHGSYYIETIKILNKDLPDIIHLHNIVNGSIGILKAIQEYASNSRKKVVVFQTLHDFGCICPRSWCTDGKGLVCSGYKNNDCHKRCSIGASDSLRLFLLKALNNKRNRIVDFFITPSECLTSLARLNGFKAYTVPNPFDSSGTILANSEKSSGDFLYFGRIGVRKGVLNLLRAWPMFSAAHPSARLSFVGVVEDDLRDEFLREVSDQESVIYEGEMEHDQMLERIRNAWCVVVPSIWMENSPNTVRESLCLGTLVIGSRRGGIPEMITDDRLLFVPNDLDAMVCCLDFAFGLSKEAYGLLISAMQESLLNSSSPQRYVDSLMSICSNYL